MPNLPTVALAKRGRTPQLNKVTKRDGSIVVFDLSKIEEVAYAALKGTKEGAARDARKVAKAVEKDLLKITVKEPNFIPHVEHIQDIVEQRLMSLDFPQSAKHFILYRQQRAEIRDSVRMNQLQSSEDFKKKVSESKKYFKNALAELVYYRTYSRWLPKKGRRETWVETIARFMDFMKENLKGKFSASEYGALKKALLNQEVVPSMRLIWASGPAARKTNVAAYNCSYISISDPKDFAEMMYISMCGTGVGFSVEKKSVEKLPQIKHQTGEKLPPYTVEDSKEGWADAFHAGLLAWMGGKDIEFDYSQVRPKGARLKTMGGRASGPEPLMDLMTFARSKVLQRQGGQLSTIEVHDIACKVGEIVVAGGVRRSAMISFSDLDDMEMRLAKQGQFWMKESQRSMANNSAIYETKPTSAEFLREWISLAESGTGERGIFNRGGISEQIPKRRMETFGDHIDTSGLNPCGEIILRSKQFCNLSGIVIRPQDTEESLLRKIRLAAMLGTYQASLTRLPYISSKWKKNSEEEALLGVSLTGYYDNNLVRTDEVLRNMREAAVETNKKYAKRLKINVATAVTCVKPSGNSSQFLDTSSGMHPRYSKYYIRRVRINSTDPLLKMLKDQGVPCHPEVGQARESATTYVLEFPVKSPEGAITRHDVSALELLEEWKRLKVNYTEHNPSATIYVGTEEWVLVANWVYNHWDIVGGLSFLPKTDHIYQLAPYEEINKRTYEKLMREVKNINFSKLVYYEQDDRTTGAKEYACMAGNCDV